MTRKAPDHSTADVSDHLGRLLVHADALLAEWKAYSDGLRSKLDTQAAELAQSAADSLRQPLIRATSEAIDELAGVGGERAEKLRRDLASAQAAVDSIRQSLRGGAAPQGRMFLALHLVTAIGIVVVIALLVRASSPAPAVAVVTVDAGSSADARIAQRAAIDAAPALEPAPCLGLRRGAAPADAIALIRSCAAVACGYAPSARDSARDKKNLKLAEALQKCQATDADSGLYRALAELVGNPSRLAKCELPELNAISGYDVSAPWVSGCAGVNGP